MALGADRASVVARYFTSGATVALAGVALGSLGGIRLGHALESQLRGVSPWDPTTHLVLATTLLVTALLAVWVPARRAARQEPMGVLREE